MRPAELIAIKRDGGRLAPEEIRAFLEGVVTGDVPDYQAAALLMAIFHHGLSPEELDVWTEVMLHSGVVLDLSDIPGRKVDKHSTGGVGDKISLPLAPLVAAAGVVVPMISGRGLGHTGGTLDKLASIEGFRTDWDMGTFRRLLRAHGCGLIGQTAEIAPADRKLYALRDATATVESIPLIASSILSKKLAEGIEGLVLDVKFGSGAFLQEFERARKLATTMVEIGERAGVRTVALLTDMNQPLGAMVGNALEVRESVDVLRGGGPADVRELTLLLGVEMVALARQEPASAALREELESLLDGGGAWERWCAIVEAQGGHPSVFDREDGLPVAPQTEVFSAPAEGWLSAVQTRDIGRAAMHLGAGRARMEDVIDPAVGLEVHARIGDRVERGAPLVTLHTRDGRGVEAARALLEGAFVLVDAPVEPPPLVAERIEG